MRSCFKKARKRRSLRRRAAPTVPWTRSAQRPSGGFGNITVTPKGNACLSQTPGGGGGVCVGGREEGYGGGEGVGVVKRVHTLSGEVRRVATALKVVEEVREEVQEIKDEWEDEEVEGNGGLKVEEKRSSHAWMR